MASGGRVEAATLSRLLGDLGAAVIDQLLAAGPAFSAFNGFGHHLRLPFWHPAERLLEALDRLDR